MIVACHVIVFYLSCKTGAGKKQFENGAGHKQNKQTNQENKVPEMQKVEYFEYPSVHDMASMHMVKSKTSDDCGTCTPA